MKVRPRSVVCEAWQYTAGAQRPPWVMACTVWEDDLYLVRRSGKQLIRHKDWLIRDLDGEPQWLTNVMFNELYESAE